MSQIGGIPYGIKCLKYRLPPHRKGRTDVIRPITLILTYVSFAIFSAARRPITVVQLKIIKECDAYVFGVNRTDNAKDSSDDMDDMEELESTKSPVTSWCKGTVFEEDAQTFMQILGSLFIGSYGILVLFSGIIADYFNPRYIITWGSLMGGFFMIVIGMANLWKIESTQYFSMALILLAAAQSTAWPILLSCATHWYQGQRRGLFFSLWNTHFYLGSFVGILLAGSNVQEAWGKLFFIPAAFVSLIGVILFFFLVIHPSDVAELDPPKESNDADKEEELPQWLDSKRTIPYYETFLIPGVVEFSGTMFFTRMVSFFFLFWRPAFLLETGKKTLRGIALYSLPYIIGGFLGGLCIGIAKTYLSKKCPCLHIILVVVYPCDWFPDDTVRCGKC
ncbi:putative glycerol-3-phosphate transporter 2 [Trichonephila inaurata madagascariensis]|uniref:Putative glycerol-3-phosphate transporter 2 n=1 Tax=Trichonephila inaurata madagascariensis TaxID=2747483 RepID=A0A8X7BTM8_9ARAC|nr:putative glycerol-3-phosphate transporter 2 [Trichonephila inaurata madagascariensis]